MAFGRDQRGHRHAHPQIPERRCREELGHRHAATVFHPSGGDLSRGADGDKGTGGRQRSVLLAVVGERLGPEYPHPFPRALGANGPEPECLEIRRAGSHGLPRPRRRGGRGHPCVDEFRLRGLDLHERAMGRCPPLLAAADSALETRWLVEQSRGPVGLVGHSDGALHRDRGLDRLDLTGGQRLRQRPGFRFWNRKRRPQTLDARPQPDPARHGRGCRHPRLQCGRDELQCANQADRDFGDSVVFGDRIVRANPQARSRTGAARQDVDAGAQ